MRDSDWTSLALIRADRSAQDILNNIPRDVQTALVDNASRLSKQAAKYSLDCGLVLLCNYQNMIALDLTTGPGNTKWNNLDHPVKYFYSNGVAFTHKKLLIAALVHGMRKAGLMANNGELSFHHLQSQH